MKRLLRCPIKVMTRSSSTWVGHYRLEEIGCRHALHRAAFQPADPHGRHSVWQGEEGGVQNPAQQRIARCFHDPMGAGTGDVAAMPCGEPREGGVERLDRKSTR